MEVYLLDVGQGTCQILLPGDRRAIVVDCGVQTDRLAVQFLKRYGVEYISCLIVSHSHGDHIGGATNILGEYQDRIERICFVQDDLFLESRFWGRISELLKEGVLAKEQLVRLERANRPQLVWSDTATEARLRTYSPTAAENLLAQEALQQNPTSAVLFFDCGKNRLIFAADSEVGQWRQIRERSGHAFRCNVLAVPHHAGAMHNSADDLKWLYAEAIRPEVAVISVGTNNTHDHPRNEVIEALKAAGARIICTQITRKCCTEPESLRPSVLRPINLLGRSSPKRDITRRGNSRNLACAGTVLVLVTPTTLAIDRVDDHQTAVDQLADKPYGHPLCR
ncbi:MAG: MBL fold metallo-hydrolase [Planctomycetota bacterium]|nr:MBL fold metallo-hydrolase [Planctomycetota bacterium]